MIVRELSKEERTGGEYTRGLRQFECLCSCGELFVITSRALKKNKVACCKTCVSNNRSDLVGRIHTKHGMCNTRFYRCWSGMKSRCNCPSTDYYEEYGGRGITYQLSWEHFENFYNDMFEGYSDDLELDRIDVNGNYTKENCKWSNESIQGYNQRQRRTNTSGRTGVYRTKDGKWWAEIQENGTTKYLGRYDSFEAAASAREAGEIEIYGFRKE